MPRLGRSQPFAPKFRPPQVVTGAAAATTYTAPASPTTILAGATTTATITPNGTYSGTVTGTPSGSASTGLSPQTTSAWSGSPVAKTLSWTPTVAGTLTITWSNSGSLTDPANDTITVNSGPVVVPVTDANWFFSPYNHYSDGSGAMAANNVRGSSTYAWTNTPQGYQKIAFTGSTTFKFNIITASLTAASVPSSNWPYIKYRLDKQPWSPLLLASDLPINLTGLSSGDHTFALLLDKSDQNYDRFTTPANILKTASITLDAGASTIALTGELAIKSLRVLFFGDSITEGINIASTSWATSNDGLAAYPQAIAAELGAEYGVIGFGGLAWTLDGFGGVPMLYNATDSLQSWNKYASGKYRVFTGGSPAFGGLFSPSPDYIFVNMGTNDGLNSNNPASSVQAWLPLVRTAAPTARIILMVPFGGYVRSNLTTAFNAYQAATPDSLCKLIDRGTVFQSGLDQFGTASHKSVDGLHPNIYTHAEEAAWIVSAVDAAFATSGTTVAGATRSGQRRRGR